MKIPQNLSPCFGLSILSALVLLSTTVMPRFVRAADVYVLTDLGTLSGGVGAYANAVNNSGQVVGEVVTTSTSYPVLFSGTGSNNLNLGLSNGSAAEATDINDSGQIVGYTVVNYHRATLFSGTGSNNTVFNTSRGYTGIARAINRSGIVVGISDDYADLGAHATSFTAGSTYTDLDGSGPYQTDALAINKGGTIIGTVSYPGITAHAAIFNGSGHTELGTLGTDAANNSYAYGISDTGTIVGGATSVPGRAYHAVIFSGTGTNNTDLGTLSGGVNAYAYAVNSSGLVVGNSQYDASGTFHGFVYKNGVMTDLNTVVINQAGTGLTNIRIYDDSGHHTGHCLNESGQIAAVATGSNGIHAILLTPQPFFNGEKALSNGVYYLDFPNGNFFGYYSFLSNPNYLYHFDLGYEYIFNANDGKNGVYFYDFASSDYFYTNPTFPFPYLYDFGLSSVVYYFPDPSHAGRYNTNGIRYFYVFSTGKIISK